MSNPYPHILAVTANITLRAKAIKLTTPAIGGLALMFIGLALFSSGSWYEGIIGISLLVFLYNTRDIGNHFNVSYFNDTSLVIHESLESFPPLNRWLVANDSKEISSEHYDELELLVKDVRIPYLDEKLKQVLSYRKGILTYYDFANLVFMYETFMRLQQHKKDLKQSFKNRRKNHR